MHRDEILEDLKQQLYDDKESISIISIEKSKIGNDDPDNQKTLTCNLPFLNNFLHKMKLSILQKWYNKYYCCNLYLF